MKTHHLIFLVTAMFVVLFYDQEPGLNVGILGILVAVLTYFNTEKRFKTRTFYSVFATSVLSSIAFAWYGDFASFCFSFGGRTLFGDAFFLRAEYQQNCQLLWDAFFHEQHILHLFDI